MKQKRRKRCKQHPGQQKTYKQSTPKKQRPYTLDAILGAAVPREQALAIIHADPDASQIFSGFPPDEQEKLISFIQGAQGLKITYDSFFKYVMNPDAHPSRLEHFLTAILGETVKIHMVLPLEGVRMADTGSFVIMDILVELSDGTTVNVEIQKIGYRFPGERASCYLADFIMRQYNRVKAKRKKQFSFRDLKPVILIAIMEESSREFTSVYPEYIHREKISYDSNAPVASLSKTIYISLDTFRSVVHNINTELDAWLTFLSTDHPADIIRLVSAYPEFLPCYHDIMEFRRNPKELIYMYSEALAILDKNTEIYMCEELKTENENLQKKNETLRKENESLRFSVLEQNAVLSELKASISKQQAVLSEITAALTKNVASLSEKTAALSEKDAALSEKDAALSEKDAEIALLKKQLTELRPKL